ncbi:MAG: sulfopyruvate decarboxylase subunit beta [Chloroflexi bacterium]|nr:sulfopyruvate decarboxylase subunit beta [Chloroflexota bacterium]
MIRRDAIEIVCQHVKNDIIVSANGFISRDLFSSLEKNTNFYMIGSMGLSSSIGLGIALKKPKKKIIVFDGDGNILMNLGSIVTIGSLRPKNLVHVIFDNSIHESTGGQPTHSKEINISKIASVSNYKVFSVKTKKDLEITLKKIQKVKGPILIHIRLSKGTKKSSRVNISPEKIKSRFMSAIN